MFFNSIFLYFAPEKNGSFSGKIKKITVRDCRSILGVFWGYFGLVKIIICIYKRYNYVKIVICVYKRWKFMNICKYVNIRMLVKCGKLSKKCGKHVDNCPKNVEMWKTCGKHVENMWKTHLYVQMCKSVGNYTNESQFFFIFFVRGYVRGYVCVCGGALQLYALARRHGTWEKNVQWVAVYRSNENGGAYIFKIRYICIYKCLIFLSVREFSLGLSVVI